MESARDTALSRRFCIVRTNGMAISFPWSATPQTGVFRLTSRLNHDCAPNAFFGWD